MTRFVLAAVLFCAGCASSEARPAAGAPKSEPRVVAAEPARAVEPEALPQVFLHQFPVEQTAALGSEALIRLQINGLEGKPFAELGKRVKSAVVSNGEVAVAGFGYAVSTDAPSADYRQSTFYVDYEEPSIQELVLRIREQIGDKPSIVQLERFTAAHIEHKNLARAFDPASVVATRREGDCSEHAVLLAALGRAFGFAARPVLGIVVIELDGKVAAFGHAWIEAHDGATWRVSDAALSEPEKRVYLPLQVMDQGGGVGTGRQLLTAGVHHVRGIRVTPK